MGLCGSPARASEPQANIILFVSDDSHRGSPFTPEPWNAPNTFGNRDEGYPGVAAVKYDPRDVIVPEFPPDTRECREELALPISTDARSFRC